MMEEALLAVRNGESQNSVAKRFNIPRTTLRGRLKGICGKHGRAAKFSAEEEQFIVDQMSKASSTGIPLDKIGIKNLVLQCCEAKGIEVCYSDNWYRNFRARHPEISAYVSNSGNGTKKRGILTTKDCEQWLTELSDLHVNGWLKDPNGLYCLDETNLNVVERIGKKVSKKVARTSSYLDGDNQEPISILTCGSASGRMLQPLLKYDGKASVIATSSGKDDNVCSIVTAGGILATYFVKVIIDSMTAEKNVIFISGSLSHICNEEFLLTCANSGKEIKLVCFPKDLVKTRQPLHLALESVREFWQNFLKSQELLIGDTVDKEDFASKLLEKWTTFSFEQPLKLGFSTMGISPFDPREIIRSVESKSVTVKQPTIEEIYAEQLNGIRSLLQQIRPLSSEIVELHMKNIIQSTRGLAVEFPNVNSISEANTPSMKSLRPKWKKRIDEERSLHNEQRGLRNFPAEFLH